MTSRPAKRRLFLVDVWIAISLLFVILGHCSVAFAPAWYEKLKAWIYSFHMGAFFFISGFLMHYTRKPMKNFSDYFLLIGDKFRKFALPFVVLGILLSLIPLAQHHFSAKAMRTALNLLQGVNTSKKGALATPAGSNDDNHFALMHGQTDIIQYRQTVEPFYQMLDCKYRFRQLLTSIAFPGTSPAG